MSTAVYMHTVGCPKNRVDSEVMLGTLTAAGFRLVADPTSAEIIVVNTCGFIESAKEESIDAVVELAYVLKHFGNPNDKAAGVTSEYDRFSVYFNQDYGAGQYRGIALQGNELARHVFAAWMAPFHDFGMRTIAIQSLGSTDHVSFDNVGLPGFQFIQDRIPGTGGHTNLDFFDTIQAEDLMKNAVVMASFAYHAAMSDERMPRKALK